MILVLIITYYRLCFFGGGVWMNKKLGMFGSLINAFTVLLFAIIAFPEREFCCCMH